MTADTAGSGGQPSPCGHRLAAVLPRRALDLQRCRLVLAFHIQLGMGALPLRPLASFKHPRLVLGTRLPLEPCLGSLAFVQYLLRLGTVAPGLRLRHRCGLQWHGSEGQRRVSFRAEPSPHLLRLRLSPPSAPAPAPRAGQRCHNRSQRNQGGEQSHHRKQHHDHQQRYPTRVGREKTRNRFARFASARWILSWKASPASGRSMKTGRHWQSIVPPSPPPGFDTQRKRPTGNRSARPRRPTPPRAKSPTQPTTTRMTTRTMAAGSPNNAATLN